MITSICLSPAIDKIFFLNDFEPGKLHRVKKIVKSAGGKGINVARVAATLGEAVTCLGFKAGSTGEWINDEIKKLGVLTDFIDVQGETRTNINIIDRKRETETELLEPGFCVNDTDIFKFLNIYNLCLKATNVLVCSGGLPEGLPNDFYRTLIELTKQYELKVILDSSGIMLEEGIKAKPYMIKPNLRELQVLSGQKLDKIEDVVIICREIIASGINVVVASMGNQGALYINKMKCMYSPILDLKIENTIGSGDSMVAGLAVGVSKGLDENETFKLSMACAAANAQFVEIGYVDKKIVGELKERIVINNLIMNQKVYN